MKGKIALIIMGLFLFLTSIAWMNSKPSSIQFLEEMNTISDEILQLVKQEKYDKAKQLLEFFSEKWTKYNHPFSLQELKILTTCYYDVKETLTSASEPHEVRVHKATKFRLMVDALQSENQPLWLEAKPQIFSSYDKLEQAVLMNDKQAYETYYQQFYENVDMIMPALSIDIKESDFVRINSHFAFLDRYRSDLLRDKEKQKQLKVIRQDLERLFEEPKKNKTDPSFIWVIISVGGIIILTLIYVGWRKYNGEKKDKKAMEEE